MSDGNEKVIQINLENKVKTIDEVRNIMDGFYKENNQFFYSIPIYLIGKSIYIHIQPEYENELRKKFNEYTQKNYNFSIDTK